MTTIKTVAERAGVSPATVSRVLSGAAGVGPDRRDRVLRAVAELGYRPNRLAANLRRQTTQTIGVVVSDIENPHFTQMVRAVEDAAFGRGCRVLLCNTDETPDKQRTYLDMLAGERVQGVILAPSDPAGDEIGRLLDLGIPLVAFDRIVDDGRADAVIVDNAEAGRRAAAHLLALGHRRIGFVGGRPEIQTGGERLAGYERAMAAAGLAPLAADGAFRLDGGRRAAETLLDGGDVTALIVANNLMTVGALQAIRERGLRVPDELALVAVDDPFWAELTDPPLTTLAQPVRRMAESAVRLLFERIAEARTAPRCLVFDVELRVRRSCGAAVRDGLVR
ncbi:MAG TPA: LacI family DNA-binding transcriptional regulator [Thermomicrobiales bacterium]|nr:LacI family DNA-binding transcriptional regulator [Thermomicrobiales bacterium]